MITPPATVPPMIARFVHISMSPLPVESCSCGRISGRIPYLDGLKSAACTPSRPRIKYAAGPPAGCSQSAAAAISMSKSSNPFIDTITVRLLSRSASTPPGTLNRISGIKRMIWANAACPWAIAVLAGVAIASRMTTAAIDPGMKRGFSDRGIGFR